MLNQATLDKLTTLKLTGMATAYEKQLPKRFPDPGWQQRTELSRGQRP